MTLSVLVTSKILLFGSENLVKSAVNLILFYRTAKTLIQKLILAALKADLVVEILNVKKLKLLLHSA